jgi:hypothetical protein
MPGSWELMQNVQVQCYTLHTELTTLAWSYGWRNLIIPGNLAPLPTTGMPFDHARNDATQHALNVGADWIFSLDSDVIPPHDALIRLIARGLPIISGTYHRRSPPEGVPVAQKNGQWFVHPPANKIAEVDVVGAGCLLVHRSVFEKLPYQRPKEGKKWFDWRVDKRGLEPPGASMSEDFTFCNWARMHGYKIYLDLSVQCRHAGSAEATYGQLKPLQTLSVT